MSHPETSHTAGAVAGPGLAPKLAESGSVKAACEATVAHIHAEEGLMPSVYVHRGGRLRCLAARGYWQAFDGMLPGAGVIGTTFQTGTTTFVPDTTTSGDYLEAAPKVRSEICAPIELEGIVVGALNVEAEHRLDASRVAWIEGCAELLGERIAELGGLPMESRSQRLARHSASIAGLVEEADVFARCSRRRSTSPRWSRPRSCAAQRPGP
ncbi:MAG: GAF domain-containing protein [Solirubrobacterales bacterium]|nr:GAF domain-containing protein [Solirubrobacterales bacterium]